MGIRLTGQLKTTAAGIALASGLMFSNAAIADQVTLKSADGTVNLVGEFVDFVDDNYIILTPLGELRISASRVRCEGDACPQFDVATVDADVAIAGSDTIGLGMMPLLMTGFAASLDADAELKNTGAGQTLATLIGDGGFGDEIGSYLVSATNDNDAFTALLEGSAKVGMSSRRIRKEEAQALRAAGAGNMVSPSQERIVAVDSMVVITHPTNEVDHLSIEQLRGIFSGSITNWSEVGGPDRAINVIGRAQDTASFDYFMSYLFGDDVPGNLPETVGENDQQVSNTVYLDEGAIGYVGYAFQRGAQPVTLVNECGIASTPDAFSAKTEEYDMARRMYLYSRADNLDASSRAFLDYAISDEADGVIGKSGFIDLGILRRAQDLTDERVAALTNEASEIGVGFEGDVMREMLEEMTNYDRLSTTLRFRTGSSRLDERGRLDLQRMVEYLENQPEGTKINFVGFTDDVGAFEANRRLSFERASSVMDEVRAFAGDRLAHIDMSSNGYGEVAASACNVTDRGKAINRRVEVWISNNSAT